MSWLLIAWLLLAAGFTGVTLFRLGRRPPSLPRGGEGRGGGQSLRRHPPVLLLRPVDAPTPLELQNLNAPVDYPGELSHVVLSPFRPRLDSIHVTWLPSDPPTTNRKVGHLVYALAALPHQEDTVVLSVDADVRVDGALISSLVDELQRGAALSSAAPRPEVRDTFSGRLLRGLLVQSHHSFQALQVMSAGAPTVCGKALALSREAQAELPHLTDCIGEDLELAHLLHHRGRSVTLASAPAQVPQPVDGSSRAVLERFARWMQVLRAHRPALFPSVPVLFAPTPLLLVLTAWVATPFTVAVLFLLVASRLALAHRLDDRPGWRFEWLLAEVLLLAAWLDALRRGRVVSWRGRRFALQEGGRMVTHPVTVEGSSA